MSPQIPKDNSTIFSIVPEPIKEFKPGIYPGWFCLDACHDESRPQRLLIDKPSMHAMAVGGKKEPIMIPTATYVLAKAVVDDYLVCKMFTKPDARPGITWIQGDVSVSEFMSAYKDEYNRIKISQKKWFMNVVKETDVYWTQSKGNPKVISDIARYAVKQLGLEKDWAKDDIVAMEHISCPACGAKNSPHLAICNACYKCVINKKAYEDLKSSGLMVA